MNPDTGEITHISTESWLFAVARIHQLTNELELMTRDLTYWVDRARTAEQRASDLNLHLMNQRLERTAA